MRASIKKIFTRSSRKQKQEEKKKDPSPSSSSDKKRCPYTKTTITRLSHESSDSLTVPFQSDRSAVTSSGGQGNNNSKQQVEKPPTTIVKPADREPTSVSTMSESTPPAAEKPAETSDTSMASSQPSQRSATSKSQQLQSEAPHRREVPKKEADPPHVLQAYDAIPVLEQLKLPRGGVSFDTKAVGRVQFGIPPETIKDSMRLGVPVPQVYIVPVERFCREMGPALGVNLAEFEFPAYFNFFVYKKRCTLVVDSEDAEENIRRVFSETLLGPAQFRREKDQIAYEEEDFDEEFPREAIPDFAKELKHFRIMPDGKELAIETLLAFTHFEMKSDGHDNLGIPTPVEGASAEPASPSTATGTAPSAESTPSAGMDTDEEDEEIVEPEEVPKNLDEVENREKEKMPWTYSQARFGGDVATVWPTTATPEQIRDRSVPRVEIFKMPGGTEYIVHDIDTNNHIIGKARFSGHVKVSDSMSVDGFGGHNIMDDVGPLRKKKGRDSIKEEGAPQDKEGGQPLTDASEASHNVMNLVKTGPPATFHPPSFGVTVLGNSHGFDKSGSVSGYVLWINGRGVMIDPPPYSTATLEKEGIRPRMIVGIILTHCHADHDAGAFQKVLTGSPVVVITTPTIYKSFIRKYAALSALSPALLRHSHRYKPAIIGQPLRFQGATFHFTYTLHTIPCVGFRVEWRGRSMVFTGDHFNSPPDIAKLEETGVLSKARADDLRSLPLQETDVLLHEAGAPPIHTPLDVLKQLPERVKKRLYVVHTSALPDDCELKVAPTGTAGTIRLDQIHVSGAMDVSENSRDHRDQAASTNLREDDFVWQGHTEYEKEPSGDRPVDNRMMLNSFAHIHTGGLLRHKNRQNSMFTGGSGEMTNVDVPLVSLRPASSTDAWFILNLLSAVPFLSSLSYSSTMEVLETAKVDAYSQHEIIVPASRRKHVLCVVWEGTCSERKATATKHHSRSGSKTLNPIMEDSDANVAVWYAGDWTGPIALQPERPLSGESETSTTHDVVAVSSEGVKVITIDYSSLMAILKIGSPLFRKYLDRKMSQERAALDVSTREEQSSTTERLLDDAVRNLNVLELLNCNSALRKLSAVQKRTLESLAEGPISYQPGERVWRAGTLVDKAFIIVSGTASFVPKRRNAGSAVANLSKDGDDQIGALGEDPGVSDAMRVDAMKAVKELDKSGDAAVCDESSIETEETPDDYNKSIVFDTIFGQPGSIEPSSSLLADSHDFVRLSRGLQKRADYLQNEGSNASVFSVDDSADETDTFTDDNTEIESQLDYTFTDDQDPGVRSRRGSVIRRRSSRARFANKVLGRLYSRRAFTGGLVFSRGHFLGDVSKMVAGLLYSDPRTEVQDEAAPTYGFGDKSEGTSSVPNMLHITDLVIPEVEEDHHIMHSSTLTAGKEGCVVLVFPKSSLIPFLDEYPGLLLSLLGTQVVI